MTLKITYRNGEVEYRENVLKTGVLNANGEESGAEEESERGTGVAYETWYGFDYDSMKRLPELLAGESAALSRSWGPDVYVKAEESTNPSEDCQQRCLFRHWGADGCNVYCLGLRRKDGKSVYYKQVHADTVEPLLASILDMIHAQYDKGGHTVKAEKLCNKVLSELGDDTLAVTRASFNDAVDIPVGHVFIHDGLRYLVMPRARCSSCSLFDKNRVCAVYGCSYVKRTDGKDAMFWRV
jgi:hypothetical protein